MKNTADYDYLMQELKQCHENGTITMINYRHASLRVGALSLYAMALAGKGPTLLS